MLDALVEEEIAQFELDSELSHHKNELKLEEECHKAELKLKEEHLKNELNQQIKKRKALRELKSASVQCKVWSETGSVKFSKRIIASRSKTGVPFAVCTAENYTKTT